MIPTVAFIFKILPLSGRYAPRNSHFLLSMCFSRKDRPCMLEEVRLRGVISAGTTYLWEDA